MRYSAKAEKSVKADPVTARLRALQRLIFIATGFSICLLLAGAWAGGRQTLMAAAPAKPPAPPAPATGPVTRALTAQDLEAFLDGLMPAEIERDGIAGATVSVVKDGQLLLAKGYGYADLKKKTPVSADDTLFRPGSISKLFTWTAVMQLVEQGKINLNTDVNQYLDFKIPNTFPQPVTVRDLMIHRPGFEETVKDLIVDDPRDRQPLGVYLATRLPRRAFPAGSTPAYSNYGAGLAGYIVQRVSGLPYEDYIVQNIFKPLDMTHSSFAQPLPASLKPFMSRGYVVASGGAKAFEIVNPPPAGALATSALDMAHFMIAHLQDGQFGDTRILQAQTAQLMHSSQVTLNPGLNAMDLGFYEDSRNGHRVIGHDGDTIYFHSRLRLIPDANVGIYVSYNSLGRSQYLPRNVLWRKFMDRYFPSTLAAAPTLASAKQDSPKVKGSYLTSRRADSTILKSAFLLSELSVSARPDGTIQVDPLKGIDGQLLRWREVAPFTYLRVGGQQKIIFQRDEAGQLELATDVPVFVFKRVSGLRDKRVILPVICGVAGIFILTLLLWPVAALVRRHYAHHLAMTAEDLRLRRSVRLVGLVDLGFMAGWLVFFTLSSDNLNYFSSRSDVWIHLLEVVGFLGAAGTIFAVANFIRAWFGHRRGLATKLHDTLLLLACLGYIWLAFSLNLLHWNLRY